MYPLPFSDKIDAKFEIFYRTILMCNPTHYFPSKNLRGNGEIVCCTKNHLLWSCKHTRKPIYVFPEGTLEGTLCTSRMQWTSGILKAYGKNSVQYTIVLMNNIELANLVPGCQLLHSKDTVSARLVEMISLHVRTRRAVTSDNVRL